MKVSINWLKKLVDLNISIDELIHLLPLRSVSIKEITPDSIELDMKGYNRADLLSMRGVAQEVAAITDSPILFSEATDYLWSGQNLSKTPVQIEDEELASIQAVAKIENLKVEQSNETWIKKLSDCGMRPVNNIVDATNLIMMEYGQPLHAFDVRDVKDETIIVRRAYEGEEITTLDGKLRKLSKQDIVLADTEKPLDIAGVMGGKDSEVKDSTTTILLSASLFNPTMVQRTSQKIGLKTEASKRFQHGLTKKRLLQALSFTIKMYESLGGKLTAISLVGNLEDPVKKVVLRREKLNSLVGIDFKSEEVEEYLKKLGFSLASQGPALHAWEVTVPYWRLDINIEEDLIEEVARMYGYEKIPAKQLSGIKPLHKEDLVFKLIYDLKQELVELGLTEIHSYSFYSTDVLNNFNPDKDDLMRVANPISSETEYLRDWLSPNLVEVVAKNIRYGFSDQAIFEIGKVYLKKKSLQPVEKYYLAIALMNGSDNPIQELYQMYQKLKSQLNKGIQEKVGLPNQEEYHKLFHPTRFIAFSLYGKDIGGIAEIHPRIVNSFGVEKRAAILEIELSSFPNRK